MCVCACVHLEKKRTNGKQKLHHLHVRVSMRLPWCEYEVCDMCNKCALRLSLTLPLIAVSKSRFAKRKAFDRQMKYSFILLSDAALFLVL